MPSLASLENYDVRSGFFFYYYLSCAFGLLSLMVEVPPNLPFLFIADAINFNPAILRKTPTRLEAHSA
jgi:hypothetical protein